MNPYQRTVDRRLSYLCERISTLGIRCGGLLGFQGILVYETNSSLFRENCTFGVMTVKKNHCLYFWGVRFNKHIKKKLLDLVVYKREVSGKKGSLSESWPSATDFILPYPVMGSAKHFSRIPWLISKLVCHNPSIKAKENGKWG